MSPSGSRGYRRIHDLLRSAEAARKIRLYGGAIHQGRQRPASSGREVDRGSASHCHRGDHAGSTSSSLSSCLELQVEALVADDRHHLDEVIGRAAIATGHRSSDDSRHILSV